MSEVNKNIRDQGIQHLSPDTTDTTEIVVVAPAVAADYAASVVAAAAAADACCLGTNLAIAAAATAIAAAIALAIGRSVDIAGSCCCCCRCCRKCCHCCCCCCWLPPPLLPLPQLLLLLLLILHMTTRSMRICGLCWRLKLGGNPEPCDSTVRAASASLAACMAAVGLPLPPRLHAAASTRCFSDLPMLPRPAPLFTVLPLVGGANSRYHTSSIQSMEKTPFAK